jgi:predicted nucleic acid-binding protein
LSGKKAKYVLDSFAILAYLAEEEGADVVEDLLNRAESGGVNLYLNYVNLGEVYYITFREKDVNEANETIVLVKRMPIEFVQVDERIALISGRIKATYSMSYADAFVAATAIVKEADIVTGDPEFESIDMQVLWIRQL